MTVTEPLNLDLSDDALLVDGVGAVDFTPRGGILVSVKNSLRRNVTNKEAEASNGVYTLSDVWFDLPAKQVLGVSGLVTPVPGDKIEVSGEALTILQVIYKREIDKYSCLSRNKKVHNGLKDQVRIEQATYSTSASGFESESWSTLLSGLNAKIQEVRGTREEQYDKDLLVQSYNIFLEDDQDTDWTLKLRIVEEVSGDVYRILSWEEADSIEKLFTLTCERHS